MSHRTYKQRKELALLTFGLAEDYVNNLPSPSDEGRAAMQSALRHVIARLKRLPEPKLVAWLEPFDLDP